VISVGWIRFDPGTGKKGTSLNGSGWRARYVSTRVYSSEKTAAAYCVGEEVPKEVFINE
jgi:hypothetical protein